MENKCPFCGSAKIRIDTPYVDPITHEHEKTFCCKAQATNHEYIEKHFTKDSRPTPEEVAKW